MFKNLIESDTHTTELKRQGSFVFGTLLVYALLLLAAGVGSIYAYEAHLENQSLEMTALVTMLPVTAAAPKTLPKRTLTGRPKFSPIADSTARVPMRTISQTDVTDMRKIPIGASATGHNAPPMLPHAVIGERNLDIGGSGHGSSFGNGGPVVPSGVLNGGNQTLNDLPPEMTKVERTLPKNYVKSLGVIESKVIYKAVPPYPEMAKKAHVSGPVTVQILLDEGGRVISARATNGNPLLRPAAERAAAQTRFSPTFLSGQPIKVTGVITFNFILQ